MSTSTLYPNISPSLNLDFSNSEVLDPRITFTRASTATYYDGVTTAKAEENLILRSEEFDNAAWVKLNSTITANTVIAPDGVLTGDRFVENSAAAVRSVNQTSTTVASTTYTLSVFAKEVPTSAKRYLRLALNTVASTTLWAAATYDLSLGTVLGTNAAGGGTVTSTSITAVGNGWYRCVLTGDIGSNTDMNVVISCNPSIGTYTNRGRESYTGDGDSGIYIWGAQLEQRSVVTSYTATTTQPITNYIPVLLSATNNVPRFDHNPTTGESLGLLIEEQRTNLFTYSADFANAAWSKFRASITSNIIVAPDGTLTGDKLVEDTTATNTHYVSDSVNLIANTSYNATVYVKAAERTRVRLQNSSTPNWTTAGSAYFDLSAGTIVSGTGSITPIGNGWYRCSINGTFGGADAAGGLNIFIVESGTTISYTGDGYSGIYIWGAQLEAGAFPTSYIATVAATATRSADAASMTGTNFSSWYNQGEGTVYFEGGIPYNYSAGFQTPYSVNDTTANNNIQPAFNSSADVFNVEMKVAGSLVAGFYPAYISGTTKLAFAYKLNDVNYAKDGTAGTTDTSATIPVVTQINLGANHTPSNFLNGHIRRISYYPLRLTNAQLQALTS